MRLDKYLKNSRLIKRRTIANEACDAGKVLVNGKVARASYDVKENDIIEIQMGARPRAPLKTMFLEVGVWGEAPHIALLLFAEKQKGRFLEVPI